ncbi:MFS transporter [Alloscardovia macacae]|uniref:MFS transporter n=1 Tax=Alloscardovia macacae TaxID=1160091 RepID=A0A1Y2T256_9BIFI|nr:MFS transporter [Alloscardovia macacae]OTA26973.1 MFS transporter [Alloscardovia macacae]OTA30039.1 MFS transporter [Alloscardovia macacae]
MQLIATLRSYWQVAVSDLLSTYATSVAETTIQLWLLNSLLIGFKDSSRYLTLYLTISSLSALIIGLFSGALSEKVGVLRAIMYACSVRIIAGLLIIGTIFVSSQSSLFSTHSAFWILTSLVVITTGSDTFYSPALTSFINRVTDSEKLIDVLSLVRLVSLMGTLLGPAIAGFASNSGAYIPILFTESFSLLAAILLVLLASRKHPEVHASSSVESAESTASASFVSFLNDWISGLKTFVHTATYRLLFPFAVLEALASAGIGFAVILFFTNVLHDTASYGWCMSAMSLGYAISFALAPRLAERMSFWSMLTLSYSLIIVSLTGLAFSPNGLVAVIFGFCFSFSQAIISPSFQTVLIRAVDESLVSQVISVFISVVTAIGAVSYSLWDFIYTHSWVAGLSPESTVLLGTVALYGVMLVLCISSRKLREITVE